MKGILIEKADGLTELFLCNGDVRIFDDLKGVIAFLKSYKDEAYYESNEWSCDLKEDDFEKDILLTITDEYKLVFYNSDFFVSLLEYRDPDEEKLVPAAVYATLNGKKSGAVRKHCRNNKIPGAFYTGVEWLIPINAPYPKDARYKDNK